MDREFIAIGIAVLTVSDTRKAADDRSGDILAKNIQEAGHHVAERELVQDEQHQIIAQLQEWIARDDIQAILVTGGTGITARDVTPEAVRTLLTKEIPGFGEVFRMQSYAKIGTSTIQSRALGGLAKDTLIFALPGSPSACKDAWDGILKAQLNNQTRPCNFIELMPRF